MQTFSLRMHRHNLKDYATKVVIWVIYRALYYRRHGCLRAAHDVGSVLSAFAKKKINPSVQQGSWKPIHPTINML